MRPAERTAILLRGACVLLVAMGLGRFAFTALLPPMQAATGFGNADAGLMASLNLAGYLLGVMWAGRVRPERRAGLFRGALVLAIVAVGAMGLPLGLVGWDVVRLVAGVTSGLLFVLATAFVLESGAALGPSGAAVHFGGVGIGIALSGLVAGLVADWRLAWAGLGGVAVVLSLAGQGLARAPVVRAAGGATRARLVWGLPFAVLMVAYSLEGMGYIVSGTFLVAILGRLPETAPLAPWAWVLAGVMAIPSPLIWARLAHRIGAWRALAVAYGVQAIGIALPLLGTPSAALGAAACFGFTFIGITGVSIGLAARLQPGATGAATAMITIGYGVGQIIGPWAAGRIASGTDGFGWSLIGAAVAVCLSALLSAVGFVVTTRGERPCPT
jgi:MFS family permease